MSAHTSAWFQPKHAEQVTRLHAKIQILEERLRGPESFQEAAVLRNSYERYFDDLKSESNSRESTGRVSIGY